VETPWHNASVAVAIIVIAAVIGWQVRRRRAAAEIDIEEQPEESTPSARS
jgi:hypothetical protein